MRHPVIHVRDGPQIYYVTVNRHRLLRIYPPPPLPLSRPMSFLEFYDKKTYLLNKFALKRSPSRSHFPINVRELKCS